MIEIPFWIIFCILIYAYFVYPIILLVLTIFFPLRNASQRIVAIPKISILVAAYNEGKLIQKKIENCLSLDYPKELVTIWIASDGSTDNTDAIVNTFQAQDSRVHLLSFHRQGKAATINMAFQHTSGEIVVFTDANTMIERDAMIKLIQPFKDAKVGCVSGRLIYRNPSKVASGRGENAYWRYETTLKSLESKIGYIAGANGALYAIRRGLFDALPSDTINDDFTISMRVVQKGYHSLYAPEAVAYEDVAPSLSSEFRRHVRDATGHYIAMLHLRGLLNPTIGVRSFIYWSHRVLRWVAPFNLICLLGLNLALYSIPVYRCLFFGQMVFYILALFGFICSRRRSNICIIFYAPFYFCSLNVALLLGFLKAISGSQERMWQPQR